MTVKHQVLAATDPGPAAYHVRASFLDLLPRDIQSQLLESALHVLSHLQFFPCGTGNVDQVARHRDNLVLSYLAKNVLHEVGVETGLSVFDWSRQRSPKLRSSMSRQSKIVWVRAQLLIATISNQKVIFQAQTSATRPVDARFDCQHHALLHRATSGLVGKGRFMCASTHAVADRVRRLSRITILLNTSADHPIHFREAGPVACERDGFIEYAQQEVQQLLIRSAQFPWTRIFGEIRPVAIRAYPDFKQGRFIFLNGTVTGRSEGSNSLPRPDQRERTRHFHLALVAHAEAMHEAFVHSPDFTLLHSSLDVFPRVVHGERGEFVC